MEELFGDEFPEAFGSSAMKSSKSILDLPAELLAVICEDLSHLDIKRLRLTCKYLAAKVDLRIQRVYISPNRANLECLQKILEHPRYRFKVCGIVWDDAQLEEYPDLDSFRDAIVIDENNSKRDIEHLLEHISRGSQDDNSQFHAFEHDDFFDKKGRLTEVAKGILLRRDDQVCRDIIAKNATAMSIEDSYPIYQDLYRDEQEIMKQGLDVAALKHALSVCPNLKRVTLTNQIWLPWEFRPSYHTAFYRSLPPGFRKPSVWPWLTHRPQSTPSQTAYREQTMSTLITSQDVPLPSEWRGYSIIVSSLISMPKPQISEFIIHAGNETTGISHQLFATFNADWINTISMARMVPLKRLKLCINSFGANHENTTSYLRAGQIHAALRTMPLLEHLDLSPNCFRRRSQGNASVVDWWFHWHDIIPVPLVRRLKTFALRNVSMYVEGLLDLVEAQVLAEHIMLDNIRMATMVGDVEATYFDFFHKLWLHYDITHSPCTRPAYTVIEPMEAGGCGACSSCGAFRSRLVFEEVCDYLHNDDYHGNIPFENTYVNQIKEGVGWVVDDRDERFLVRASDYMGTQVGEEMQLEE
jgi:hypothetical protein